MDLHTLSLMSRLRKTTLALLILELSAFAKILYDGSLWPLWGNFLLHIGFALLRVFQFRVPTRYDLVQLYFCCSYHDNPKYSDMTGLCTQYRPRSDDIEYAFSGAVTSVIGI